jgi:hypothetical protein
MKHKVPWCYFHTVGIQTLLGVARLNVDVLRVHDE